MDVVQSGLNNPSATQTGPLDDDHCAHGGGVRSAGHVRSIS